MTIQKLRTGSLALARHLCLATAVGACSGADAPPKGAAGGPAWRVSEQPRVVIGQGEEPGHQLDRVYGGVVRPDGSILVGNSGTGQLRLFDSKGALRSSAGRRGAGPGEFLGINWVRPYRGDSILVFDMRAQRFSVWTAQAAFGRTFRAQTPRGAPRPAGVFADGSIVLVSESQYDPRQGPGSTRDRMTLTRISPTGELVQELGSFPGGEWLVYQHPASYRAAKIPFGRQGHVAVAGQHFVYASSESGLLSVYDTVGRLVRRVAVPVSPEAVSREEIRIELAGIEDAAERRALRGYFDQNLARLHAPAVSDVRTDVEGNLWVQTSRSAGPAPDSWVVVSPSGAVVGSAALPAGALPLDIRRDALLVRESDSDGVQRVALREVRR